MTGQDRVEGTRPRPLLGWLLMPILSAVLVMLAAPYLLPLVMNLDLPGADDAGPRPDSSEGFGLDEVIHGVRRDLMASQQRLLDDDAYAMFQVETFDIELSFIVKRGTELGAEGGAPQFLVVSGTGNYQREQVQKILLHLSTVEPGDAEIEILSGHPPTGVEIRNLE